MWGATTLKPLLRGETVASIIIVLQGVRLKGKVETLLLHKKNYPP
jgi:hypothetical protein